VTFDVAASAYDRFMGRWFGPLAEQFVELAGVHDGQRVLDVGCGRTHSVWSASQGTPSSSISAGARSAEVRAARAIVALANTK